MTTRARWTTCGLIAGWLAAFGGGAGCGSHGTGGSGGRGGSDGSTSDGSSGAGGAAAGTDGGASDAPADVPAESPASDAPAESTPSDGSTDVADATDASDLAAEAAPDGAGDVVEAPPPYDAGSDCIAPSGEAALDATAAGLPSSGLVLWLRGDRGVYKTAANAVCAWADQSGHGTIFTPTGARPSWSATGLGGLAAVHSTTGGDGLATGGLLGLAPTSARTIVAVVQLVSTTNRYHAVYQGQSGTPGTYLGLDANTFNTVGSREGVYMMNNAYDSGLATSTSPRVHVYTISTMTPGTAVLSGIDYRVNGATQTLTRTPGGLGNGNFEDFTGANYTSVATGAEGVVAEVLVYGRALTTTERAAVEAALEARYGIQ